MVLLRRVAFQTAFLAGAFGPAAHAGPIDILAHYDASLDNPAARDSFPTGLSRSDLVSTAPADGRPHRWFVVAVVANTASFDALIHSVSFGLGNYATANVTINDWGPCVPESKKFLEIPQTKWPQPDTGTAVVFAPCDIPAKQCRVIPVYWFVTTASQQATIRLARHPTKGSKLMLCGENTLTTIAEHGTMGIGTFGTSPDPRPH